MAKKTLGSGRWVTINGTHVFIEGGKVTKGPSKFIGSTVADMAKATGNPNSIKATSTRRTKEAPKEAPKEADSEEIIRLPGKRPRVASYNPNNPTGLSREEKLKEVKAREKEFSKLSKNDVLKQLEENRTIQNTAVLGSKEFINARLNVDALMSTRNSKLTSTEVAQIIGSTVRQEYHTPTREYTGVFSKIPASSSSPISEILNRPTSTAKKTTTSTGAKKYPSGITTTAQKRAYTRALNSGMSPSEAKNSVLKK